MSRKGVLRFLLQILLPGTLSALLIASLGSVQPVAAATPYIDNSFTSTSSAPVGAYGLNKSFFPSTGDYTAEIWARRDGTYAANTRYTLFSSNGKYLYVYNNNFWWHHDDGSDTDTGVVAPKDEWFHVAVLVTTSTKTLKLVLNGATTAWSKTFTTLTTTAGFVGIGASNYVSPYNYWQGQLDQFKVWASVLSDAQLSQSMNTYQSAGITGSPTLNFLYDMNTVSVNNIDAIVGTNSLAVVGPGQFAWTDVKTTDSSTIPGKTIYGFPRTYLNAEGGWRAPTGMNATYQYLSVAGGGGGGSGRGGGGGAGGFLTGSVSIPSSAVYSVIVGAGGYANTNGGNTQLQNVNASSAVVASTGGGGGGNGSTAADGLAGGSGGGASICYAAGPVRPQGGAGVAGQGNAGASNDGTNCTTSPEFRQTGGGGGSSAAGVAGSGGSNNPTAATAGQVRPDGGAGTVSSITGTAVTYAAGGGGAIALATGQPGGVINSAYFGSGGSGIGGNGAAVGGYGSAATPNTGSGGGGGGYISASNYLYTGGMGSNGVLYLVATAGPTLSTPAAGASLNRAVAIQPTLTVASGSISVTGCSVVDANGSSTGVSVSCSAASGTGSVTLSDLTFTSGTLGQTYTLIFAISGGDEVRQEIKLYSMPASITVASTGATANFAWDAGTLMATSDNQAITVLASDVQTRLNSYSLILPSLGTTTVNASFTGTTSGNGVIFKSLQYVQAASTTITTANGPVTIWATNPNTATGTTGVTGVLFNSSAQITTAGGNITIGGGANPLTSPVTAEVGINFSSSAKLTAAGGNISLRADSVLNSSLNTANDQMKAIYLSGSNFISTTGSGNITIVANGNGAANGYRGLGFAMTQVGYGSTNSVSVANGNISITGGNLGSGNVIPVAIGLTYNTGPNNVTATGTGNITIVGDGRGSTTTTTASANGAIYGVLMNYYYNTVTTVDGNVSVTGYGGNSTASTTAASSDSVGVYTNAGQIRSTGNGSVTVYGQGGSIAGTVTGKLQNSIGVYNASWISTTTKDVSVTGLAGSVGGAAGAEYGFWSAYPSGIAGTNFPGSILSTSGNIILSGDTSPVISGSTSVSPTGIYTSPAKIKSTSGNVTVTGTVCSTCTSTETSNSAYGVYVMNNGSYPTWTEIGTGGSGTVSITGRADNESSTTNTVYGMQLGFDGTTRNQVYTQNGAISLTGSAVGGVGSRGINLSSGGVNTTGGNITLTGTTNAPSATSGSPITTTTFNVTSTSGNITMNGTTNGATTGSINTLYLVVTTVKTTTGSITLDGEAPSVTNGGTLGLGLSTSTVSTGDSVAQTQGGPVSLTGVVGSTATGNQTGVILANSTVDAYNNSITILANGQQANSNSGRKGLSITGTVNLAANASTLNVTAYGAPWSAGAGGSTALWQENGSTLNVGGTSSHVNATFNVDAWNKYQITTPVANFDTDGSIVIQPIGTSFGPDMFNTGSYSTDNMKTWWVPTTRIASFTIGKPGNTRGILLGTAMNLSTSTGKLIVYSGDFSSVNSIQAQTLAVQSSGQVAIGNASNSFTNVALVRGSATAFSVANAAASWTAGTYSGVTGVYGVPATLAASGTPPSTATLGSAMASYSVIAKDAYGLAIAAANTRSTDAVSVTASIKSGASTALGGTTTQTGTAAAAIAFTDLTFNQPGVHTLAFDATGFTQYVSPNITVSGGTPTISLSYFSGTNSTTFVSATTTASPTLTKNSTGTPTYTSSTTGVCTVVSGTGVITTKTPGTCTITVSVAADATYLAGSSTVNITINKMAQSALSITSTSGSYGSPLTLTYSGGSTAITPTYVVDSGTCSVSGTILTLGNVGDACMVTATMAGNATYNAVSSASTSITTNKGNQSNLVTPATTNLTYLSAGIDLSSLTITGGNGTGSISFSTVTTGCSINGTTLTSTNNAGTTCAISAVKAGDTSYNTGSAASFNVTIVKANQAAISVTSTSATYGQGLSLTYSGGSGTGAVTFALVSGSCTVSGTTLTPTAATNCVITVSKAADTNYYIATSANTTVTIAKGTQAALTITSVSGAFGSALTLTTSGGTDNGAVTYVVDSGTCSMATTLTINLGAVGDACMVTATKAATSNYNAISSSSTSIATVRASQATLVAPSGVTLTYANANGLDLTTLTFTGGSGTGSISFTTATSGCSIANNVLTSTNNAATTCTVASAKAGDSSYLDGTAVNLTVTITKATQAALTISSTTGTYGTALTLTTSGGTDNGAVTYVKDSGTCTLAAGVLTLGNAGSACMVTATKAATTNYNAISSVSTSITTNKTNQATLTITSTSGTFNTALTLTTSGGTDTGAVTYFVDSGTCTVVNSTLTLGNAGDTCFVTATKAATTNYNATSSVSTSISTGRAAQAALVAPSGVTIVYGGTGIDLATVIFTGGSGTGALVYSTATAGCAISNNVLTSTNNAATSCVVATYKSGDSNYSTGTSVNLSVSIVKANQQAITITTTSATYPTTLSLAISGGSGTGATSYSVVSGSCTVAAGVLTPTGAGSCVITATVAADTNYNATTSSNTTITIAKGTQSTVSITSSTSLAYLATQTLTATGGSSGASGYVFATTTTGCSITNGVLSSTLGATNTCDITAYKAGDVNWNDSNTATRTVTIVKANQGTALTLPVGTTLSYNNGSGLDLATLNITGGNGTGSLTYTPTTVGCNLTGTVLTTANLANTNCLIDVARAGDSNYNTSSAASLTIGIVTANQPAITVTSTSGTYGQTLLVTYTGGIGTGAVTYSATGTCTVDASGVLTFTAAGATGCSVTVSKAAETNKYNSATSSATTVAVNKGTQATVSFTSATTMPYAGSLTLTATGGSSSASSYTFATSSNNCTVTTATLTSTLSATNTCAISVYKAGDANWLDSNTATATVTIAKANQATVVVPSGTNLTYGDSTGINLSALSITGGSGTGSIGFSSATSGCTVTSSTLTSTNNAGTTCNITTTKAGDANYNASTGVTLTVTIVKANQAALTITSTSGTYGQTLSLTTSGGTDTGAVTYAVDSGTCSVAGATLTLGNAGSACMVTATKATSTNYNAISSTSTSISTAKANQAALTISTTSGTYGQTLSLATSGGTDTGAVSYTVNSGTCSVTSATLTLGNAGSSCMVTATKAATTNYNSVSSSSTSITTAKANQAALVAPTGVNLTYGASNSIDVSTLTFTGGSGTGSLSYTTSTNGCSLSGTVLTSTNNAGTTCIVATTKSSDTNYNASGSVNLTVNVVKANQDALSVTSTSATYPSTLSLTYSGGSGTGAVTFTAVSGSCTISGTTLTPTGAGSCQVRVSRAADVNYYVATSADTTVTINKGSQASVSITSATSLEYASTMALTATGGSGTASGYVFATSTNGCTVTGSTLSSTLGATGSCAITAYKAADSNYNVSTTVSQTVTIVKANQVTAMSVPSGVTMTYLGTGVDLTTLTYTGGDGTGAYTFSTSTAGCTISGSNVLTSTLGASSTCLVSVVKAADANYNASTAGIMQVTVTQATQAALTVTSTSATFGSGLSLTATGGSNNGVISYAKVSGPCTVIGSSMTPTGAGDCVVTATMASSANYLAVTSANTTITIAKANQAALNWSLSATAVPYLGSLTLATSGGSGTGSVVFTASQNSACTVSGTTLTVSTVGSVCDVTATKVGDSNYNSKDTTTQSFTVTPIAQSALSFTSASSVTYGQTLTLLAIGGNGDGAISYSINNAGVTGCTVAGSTLSVTAAGTCVVSAIRAASNNYNASSAYTQSITVNKAAQSVSFSSSVPASPVVGNTYNVTGTSTSGANPTFAIGLGGCTISGTTVTFTATGSCRIDMSAAATSQYLASPTVSQTIAVGQRNQTLTFGTATAAISSATFGDASFAATADSSVSGLAATYSTGSHTTNNACSVSSAGVVTIIAVGTCEIRADQAGDANTAPASAIYKSFPVVADIANAPTIVSVSASDQAITAAFIAPSYTGGAAVSGYQLVAVAGSITIANSGCTLSVSSQQTCTVSGLTNGTSYQVKVAAINSAGVGNYSSLSANRVPATNPAAVGAFTVVPDNTQLLLSWTAPVSLGGGVFDSYRIYVKPAGTASYPSTYISVTSQAALGYTVTGLINGQAYDVRIVTVTTANTLPLVSNTAEAAETPRTVPDAPASILVFEAAGNLIISWTSPLSDGGAAITAYSATLGTSPCVLATPVDTTCTVSAPVAPGTYPIEVKAQNPAGYGASITSNFTRAAVQIPGGGSQTVNAGADQMRVLGFNMKTLKANGGQVLVIQAANMADVQQVFIDGSPAKLISATSTELQILMPAHIPGNASITFIGPKGRLNFVDAVTYEKTGEVKLLMTTIRDFVMHSSTLSTAMKRSLKALLASHPQALSATCVGYQSLSYNLPIDAQVALQRASNACNYLKALNPKLVIKSVVARTSLQGPVSRKLVIQLRDAN